MPMNDAVISAIQYAASHGIHCAIRPRIGGKVALDFYRAPKTAPIRSIICWPQTTDEQLALAIREHVDGRDGCREAHIGVDIEELDSVLSEVGCHATD